MDFGTPSKPAPVSGAVLVPRADIVAAKGGVAVELPPEKTVQSAKAGEAIQIDVRARSDEDRTQVRQEQRARSRQSEQGLREVVERRLVIEPRTRSIVIQKRDRDTGETIELVPDEATLKLRIYARQLAERTRDDTLGNYVERSA